MRIKQRGIVTLTLLILLSSLLMLHMLFNDDILRLYSTLVSQRMTYLKHNFYLQQVSQTQKDNICENLTLQSSASSHLVVFESHEQKNNLYHFIWCKRQALFKNTPKTRINEGLFNTFIEPDYLPLFEKDLFPPPAILPKDQLDYFYWFDHKQTEWILTGDIHAVIVAEGDLIINGKGHIRGTVITGGTLSIDEQVKITYRKSTVTNTIEMYSHWKRAKRSWNDFKAN